jgi:hypothetical protein
VVVGPGRRGEREQPAVDLRPHLVGQPVTGAGEDGQLGTGDLLGQPAGRLGRHVVVVVALPDPGRTGQPGQQVAPVAAVDHVVLDVRVGALAERLAEVLQHPGRRRRVKGGVLFAVGRGQVRGEKRRQRLRIVPGQPGDRLAPLPQRRRVLQGQEPMPRGAARLGRRGQRHRGHPVAEQHPAGHRVRAAAGAAGHREPVDAEGVHQRGHVGRPVLEGASWLGVGAAEPGPVRHQHPVAELLGQRHLLREGQPRLGCADTLEHHRPRRVPVVRVRHPPAVRKGQLVRVTHAGDRSRRVTGSARSGAGARPRARRGTGWTARSAQRRGRSGGRRRPPSGTSRRTSRPRRCRVAARS